MARVNAPSHGWFTLDTKLRPIAKTDAWHVSIGHDEHPPPVSGGVQRSDDARVTFQLSLHGL